MPFWREKRGLGRRAGEGKGRGLRPVPLPPAGVFKTASVPEDVSRFGVHWDHFVPLPNETPF